jgi:hypothetical protein
MDCDKKTSIEQVRTAGGETYKVGETAEIGETKTLELGHGDIGYDLYQEALQVDPIERQRIAKTVKLKLDSILLPLVRYNGTASIV